MFDVIQTAKDFGVDVEWAISRRKEFLKQRIVELESDQQAVLQAFSGNNEFNRFLLLDSMKFLNKEIRKCEIELNFKDVRNCSRITQADVERARTYPVENLLQNVRNSKTHCISGTHPDKHPSMSIKNNFAYCYSCGYHGDAIAIYKKLHSVDFVMAVKALNSV